MSNLRRQLPVEIQAQYDNIKMLHFINGPRLGELIETDVTGKHRMLVPCDMGRRGTRTAVYDLIEQSGEYGWSFRGWSDEHNWQAQYPDPDPPPKPISDRMEIVDTTGRVHRPMKELGPGE